MIFKPAARYPADPRAVFVLALSVFGGLTALLLNVAPESLDALLPQWAVISWGVILATGSAITLGGMAFQSVNGIITEQVGNVMVSAATIFYSAVAFLVVGISAIQAVGIVLAWGLACGLRWVQLQVLINSAYKRQMKQEMLVKIFDEIEGRKEREGRNKEYSARAVEHVERHDEHVAREEEAYERKVDRRERRADRDERRKS